MENQITVFQNERLGRIRTCIISGNVWFVAKDVCDILGYSNSRKAIKDHVYNEDVTKRYTLTNGGFQNLLYVNESGIYALIFGSKLEKARQFKHWVTSEVLPSIRKTGSYGINQDKAIANELKLQTLSGICRRNEYLGINTTLVGSFPQYQPDDTEQTVFGFSKCELRILSMFPQSGISFTENEYDKEQE